MTASREFLDAVDRYRDAANAVLARLESEREELLSLLREAEWGTENLCPCCWGKTMRDMGYRATGHDPDCRLAKALGAA